MKYQQDARLKRKDYIDALKIKVDDDALFKELLIKLVIETPIEAWRGEAKLSFTKVDPATFDLKDKSTAWVSFVNDLKKNDEIFFNVRLIKP
jgi:hypothetical protein